MKKTGINKSNEEPKAEFIRLTDEAIDAVSEKILLETARFRIDRQTAQRIRLTVEELLLRYRDELGEESETEVEMNRRLGKVYLSLKIKGKSFNPFEMLSEEDLLLHNTMESLGYAPDWHYEKGSNRIVFTLRRPARLPAWAPIVIAAVAGIAFGLGARLLPGDARITITYVVLSPLSSAIMGFLGTISVIMIFLSIINGICGMGNMATFNLLGKRMIGRFLLLLAGLSVAVPLLLSVFYPVTQGAAGDVDLSQLWQMILQIIPSNIITAFSTGNTLQVIFLAVCLGIVTLTMIRRMHALTEWTSQLNLLVQALVEVIIKLLPIVVFISVFNLFSNSNTLEELKAVYRFPLLHLVFCSAWLLFLILRTAITQKVNPLTLIKKMWPTFVITLSTASSSAAFSTTLETCEKKLGVDKQLVNVGTPISHSLFKPAAIIEDLVGVFCLAHVYGVELTWSSVITLVITVYVLSLATPPLPGAAISCFALLFTQCGIPSAAISVVIALNAVTDRVTTPTIVLSGQLELVQLAASLGKLDREKLRKKA